MPSPSYLLEIEPTLVEADDGSWLAVAGKGSPVRVGVIESTREAARERFQEALSRVVEALAHE